MSEEYIILGTYPPEKMPDHIVTLARFLDYYYWKRNDGRWMQVMPEFCYKKLSDPRATRTAAGEKEVKVLEKLISDRGQQKVFEDS